jgi:hypothetical protein
MPLVPVDAPRSLALRARVAIVLSIVASSTMAPAHAQDAVCKEFAWPLARELAWLSAADLPAIASGATAPINAAVVVKLRLMGEIAFAMPPERAPKIAGSFGAALRIESPGKAGLYQITLSEEAWIDVVQNDSRAKSAAFSGKQGCAGMRKSVRFNLAAAPFVIQISGAATDRLAMAVAPAE